MRYPCPNYEFTASRAEDLKIHVESKHEEVRYPCPKCEFASTSRQGLMKHQINKH